MTDNDKGGSAEGGVSEGLTINGQPWKVVVGGAAISFASWVIALGIEADRNTDRAQEFKRTVDYCWSIMRLDDPKYAPWQEKCRPFLKGQAEQRYAIDYTGVERDSTVPFIVATRHRKE